MPFSAPLVVATTAARGTGHLIRAVPEVATPGIKENKNARKGIINRRLNEKKRNCNNVSNASVHGRWLPG